MSIIGALRSLAQLGFDVGEAIFYGVFDFDRVADEMWAEAAGNSAERSPECDCSLSDDLVDLDKHSAVCSIWDDWELSGDDDNPYVTKTSSPATASAGGVHPSCSVQPPDVEQEGLQPLSVSEFADIVIELHDIATHMAWLGSKIPQDRLEVIADRLAAAGLAMK